MFIASNDDFDEFIELFASSIALFDSKILFFVVSISNLISEIIPSISFTDCDVCSDNFLISSATTPKPFPASPALAASMAAFKDKRLVCSDIEVIVVTIFPIDWDFS